LTHRKPLLTLTVAALPFSFSAPDSPAQKLTREQKKEQKKADAALEEKLQDELNAALKISRFQGYVTGDGSAVSVKVTEPGLVLTVLKPQSIPATRLIHHIPAAPTSNTDALLGAIGGTNKPFDGPESFDCYLPALTVFQGGLLPDGTPEQLRNCSRDRATGTARYLDPGEKLLLLSIGVQAAGDRVLFSLVTYHPVPDDTTGQVEYFAKIGLQYPRNYLNTITASQIVKDLYTVIGPETAASAPAPQPPAPLPPPPPPPPPTPTQTASIQIGMTTDQVTAAMGAPQKIIKLGAKSVYLYDGLKITFLNGKVSAME